MLKKNKKIQFEGMDLKPQSIGYTYKKKSNFGRVIIIFALLILAVYYINDISLYINNLIGKKTASTIRESKEEEKELPTDTINSMEDNNYYEIKDNTEIFFKELTIKDFEIENSTITFNVNNNTTSNVDLSNTKVYIELYNSDKTLIKTYKVDLGLIKPGETKNNVVNINNTSFVYFKILEKSIADYPNIELTTLDNRNTLLTCSNDIETYKYTFTNDNLKEVSFEVKCHISSVNYRDILNNYKELINSYKGNKGITTYFSSNSNGFNGKIEINYEVVDSSITFEKQFFSANELSKVISYEMTAYNYKCN